MLSYIAAVAITLATLATSQTPPNSKPATQNNLIVSYRGETVKPNESLSESRTCTTAFFSVNVLDSDHIAFTASAPDVSLKQHLDGTYMVIMMDLSISDSLVKGTPPSELVPGVEPNRTTLVQWMQTNLTQASNGSFVSQDLGPAVYVPTGPPPGDIPHTYVFYLFHQPADFTFPGVDQRNLTGITGRLSFSTEAIARKVGAPLAANFMRVAPPAKNSSTASSTKATASATGTSTPTPSSTYSVPATGGAASFNVVTSFGTVAFSLGVTALVML